MVDKINPQHYKRHPSGVECIQITEWFMGNRANAIKYIWRAGEKDDELEDLRKAEWYIKREIQRVSDMLTVSTECLDEEAFEEWEEYDMGEGGGV